MEGDERRLARAGSRGEAPPFLAGGAKDSVVRHRDVNDIRGSGPRHVARGTGIGVLLPPRRDRDVALGLCVASQAPSSIVLRGLVRGRLLVRIVTRGAAELPPTLREAGALIHLLDVPDSLLPVRHAGMPDEGIDEEFERQAGAEVEDAAAGSNHPCLPLKVALLADRLSKHRLEVLRIDDRVVDPFPRARGCFTCNSPGP